MRISPHLWNSYWPVRQPHASFADLEHSIGGVKEWKPFRLIPTKLK